MDSSELRKLKVFSAQIRIDTIKILKRKKGGHLGGSLSIVELLSTLYGKHLRHDPKNPKWEGRDFLVLSKGHAGPALYSALANRGFFDKEKLYTLNEIGTNLPSHPDRQKTPGVDATTGSLGQGTSQAAGLGYSLRMENSDQRVYLICGDGELNEGQVWEAFQFIAHNKLNEVIVFIDNNHMQLDGTLEEIMNPFDIAEKMRAFGFETWEVDGKDEEAIDKAITEAKLVEDKAVAIVLDTVKCQGVEYYYGRIDNHSPKFADKENAMLDEVVAGLEDFIAKEDQDV